MDTKNPKRTAEPGMQQSGFIRCTFIRWTGTRLFVALVVLCVASSPCRAQGQQQEDMAKQVIARYSAAIGGSEAWHKLSTLKGSGTVRIDPP